jgi:RND family efflux transporter MFP subunit
VLPRVVAGRGADRPLTAVVARGELRVTVTDRGELESIDSVSVSCELQGGGKLVTIVDEGKRVKKGEEVAKLDPDAIVKLLNEQDVKWQTAEGKVKTSRSDVAQARYKAETEISKADLAQKLAKIDLESYEHPNGEYRKELDDKRGKLELYRKQLKEAEDDLAFTRGMVKDGFAPLEQLRPRELTVQQRKFEVTSGEADIVLLEKFTKTKKLTEYSYKADDAVRELKRTQESQRAAIEKAQAELRSAESNEVVEKRQLERLREQIDRCTIRAPSDGILVYSNSRYWDDSSRIRPGAQLYYRQEIFTLPDLSRMRVKVKIHESVVKKVRPGMPATMQVDALGGRMLHGTVRKIGTIAQSDGWRGAGVKQYETEVSIDDLPADAGLKPGMTAEVRILVTTVPDAVTVPIAAVTEYEGRKVVYVAANDRVERREVTLGESNEQFAQILDGVQPGEAVALDARTRAANELKASNPDGEKGKGPEKGKDGSPSAVPVAASG